MQINGTCSPAFEAVRAAEIPAANGHGNARSMSRVHSVLACGGELDGVRLLSAATIARILEVQIEGNDLAMDAPQRFGMGFGLPGELMPMLANRRVFFWAGWGCAIAGIVGIAVLRARDPAPR